MVKTLWLLITLTALLIPAIGQAQETSTPTPETLASAENLPATINALDYLLADYLNVQADEITINALQEMSYSDSCMGVALPQETCARVVVSPAYSVTFGTQFGEFEFHVHGTTGIFRLASPMPMQDSKLPVIFWQRTGTIAGVCHRLYVADDGRYLVLECYRIWEDKVLAQGVLSDSDMATINDFLLSASPMRWISPVLPNMSDQAFDTYVAYSYGTELPSEEDQANFNDTLAELTYRLMESGRLTATPVPVDGDNGIEGQVTIGPMCPVEREDDPCPDAPYQATITVIDAAGEFAIQFQSDPNGYFHVPLRPGLYILRPESPNVMPSAPEQTVIVNPGEYTQVTINYDSGIR